MKVVYLSLLFVSTMAGCRTSGTTHSSEAKDTFAPGPAALQVEIAAADTILVPDSSQDLAACVVYTRMKIEGGKALLSNWQHVDPRIFCAAVAIPADNREYTLRQTRASDCGDVFEGTNGLDQIKIVDYRRATCEIALPSIFLVTETRDGEVENLGSKDDYQLPAPSVEARTHIMVPDATLPLHACAVYTELKWTATKAVLSNWQHIDPRAFCPMVQIEEDRREYDLELISASGCGDVYQGTDGVNTIEIVDMSNALCEIFVESLVSTTETRNGQTVQLGSKDSFGGLDSDL